MHAVRKVGLAGCGAPDFGCVSAVADASVPAPLAGEVLLNVTGSGVNPDEITLLALPAAHYTLGIDVAGVVVALGGGGGHGKLQLGDRVWCTGTHGGMAQFAVRPEALCAVVPPGVDMVAAGTLPTVGMTVYGALRSAGAPWPAAGAAGAAAAGPTVVITAGTGGTGYVAVQLAKALGAARVITAATGAAGIALAKALGADVVVDYKRASVYSAVGAAGADVVLSNHKSNTTAALAMGALARAGAAGGRGGVYVTLDGDVAPAGDVPAGVTQVAYDLFAPAEALRFGEYLDALAGCLVAGTLRAEVQRQFGFGDAAAALNVMAQGQVLTKLAVVPPVAAR